MALNKKRFQLVDKPKGGVILQEKNFNTSTEDAPVWRTLSHHADKGSAEKAAGEREKSKPIG